MDDCVRTVTELEIRRLALGLDRPEMCVQIELCCEEGGGINARTLLRWETRLNKPVRLFRHALCRYFQVGSVALLGLGPSFEAARWWTYMTPEEMTEEMLHRRKMLHGMGAASATCLLLPVSKLVASAQLLDGQPRLGAGDLAFARQTATDIAVAYAATPNADARRAAQMHAYTLLDLLKHATMSPQVETQLRAVASDAASLAGYAQYDAGWLDEADRWFDTALTLARQAGDRRLEAHALASRAWPAIERPQPDHTTAAAALEAAAQLHPFLPPAGQAWLFAYLARERATLGDDLVSGRFLEQARSVVARIRRHDAGWGWWSTHGELAGFDGVRPDVFAGVRLLRLGRPAAAAGLLDGTLDRLTEPIRRADLQWNLMHACVALGNPDRACASGIAALDEIDAHHGLKINVKEIRETRRSFPREWNSLRSVIELDERLHAIA